MTYLFLTMFLWGLIPIIDKRGLSGEQIAPEVGLVVRLVAAFLLVVLVVLIFPAGPSLRTALKSISWRAIAVFSASGVLSMVVSQFFYYHALKDREVNQLFPVLFGGAPVVGVFLSWLILGEAVSVKIAAGSGLITLGTFILLW